MREIEFLKTIKVYKENHKSSVINLHKPNKYLIKYDTVGRVEEYIMGTSQGRTGTKRPLWQ
jgi:hypothetical protein